MAKNIVVTASGVQGPPGPQGPQGPAGPASSGEYSALISFTEDFDTPINSNSRWTVINTPGNYGSTTYSSVDDHPLYGGVVLTAGLGNGVAGVKSARPVVTFYAKHAFRLTIGYGIYAYTANASAYMGLATPSNVLRLGVEINPSTNRWMWRVGSYTQDSTLGGNELGTGGSGLRDCLLRLTANDGWTTMTPEKSTDGGVTWAADGSTFSAASQSISDTLYMMAKEVGTTVDGGRVVYRMEFLCRHYT